MARSAPRVVAWAGAALLAAGCAKPGGDAQGVPPKPSASASASAPAASAGASAPAASASAAPASASASAPGVRTSDFPVAVGVYGAGRLAIVDMAKHDEEISPRVTIEKRSSDGSWKAVPGEAPIFRWTEDCAPAKAGACTRLQGGSTFSPVPWRGRSCGGQCSAPCEENANLLPGDFRWVVRACGHEEREITSPVVSLPDRSGRALERWGFAQGITSAEAVRLDVAARPGAGVLGYPRRNGTEKPLSREAIADLAGALASEQGYDDAVERRCASRDLVGLVLVYEPAASTYGEMGGGIKPIGSATAHVVLDFGCRRMLAQWVGVRTVWRDTDLRRGKAPESTYFDGLAPRLLAFARAALPGDRELAAVK